MRILLLNQYYAPDEAATAQLLSDLGAALSARGHSVTAIAGDRSYTDPTRRFPKREEIDGVRVRRVRTSGFGRSTFIGRGIDYFGFAAGAMLAMLRAERPDVVISLSTPPMIALAGARIARLRGAKSIFWCMDVYPDLLFALGVLRRRSLAGSVATWLSKRMLRAQSVVIALGETMAGKLRQAGARRVEVIHNWADDAITPANKAGDRFVVLYSGNLGLSHEFDTVLAAAERLRDDPGVLFEFVGTGPRLASVQERRLPNVEIRPPVAREKLSQSLATGDVHLITLRSEAMGLVVPSKIYGILAAGRPAIYVGPAEGEVFDIVSNERCGTHVRNGDVDALVAAIQKYRSQPEVREADAKRARDLFMSHFTKQRAIAHFEAILRQLTTDN